MTCIPALERIELDTQIGHIEAVISGYRQALAKGNPQRLTNLFETLTGSPAANYPWATIAIIVAPAHNYAWERKHGIKTQSLNEAARKTLCKIQGL